MPVFFSQVALEQLQHYANEYPHLSRFITQVLQQDPRPAYKKMSKVIGSMRYTYSNLIFAGK